MVAPATLDPPLQPTDSAFLFNAHSSTCSRERITEPVTPIDTGKSPPEAAPSSPVIVVLIAATRRISPTAAAAALDPSLHHCHRRPPPPLFLIRAFV
ncbi:hypothetical protein B296_00051615 [Ensete ventricosum]|uniref:Uncharacterized protein n=1 Tax=Ensete ventricosum TaxID=4639 RepID=A0A426YB94_ENSVE|nr:hypothetical protein B296_00051615 [Ensete ventricosum]